MFDYSADNLIASVRDLTYAGTSTRDWPTDKLLRLINREISSYLVPLITRARTNHFVVSTDIPCVSGQQAYLLPSKASGEKLRAVVLVDGKNRYQLTERDIAEGIVLT